MMFSFMTYDVESNNWIDFEFLGLYDGNEFQKFDSIPMFLNHIDQKKFEGITFFAHNGGKFDDLFLIEPMYKKRWNVSILERGGRIILINVETLKGISFKFADSIALMKSSQEKLAKAFGVKHQKVKFDFSKHRVSKRNKEIVRRCKNDCVGLYELLQTFYGQEFIHEPKLTIASQAMNTFLNKFTDAELVTLPAKYEDVFREHFYSGGRVEVYKGRGHVFVYDVRSLYPTVMLEEMPTGDCKKVHTFDRERIGFYHVEIKSMPDFYISPFLVKKFKNIFPVGRGMYYCSSALLSYLKKQYGIRFNVLVGYVFKEKEHLFVDYVKYFYKMKSEHGKDAIGYISKLMLNSLYGKFNQRRENNTIEVFNGQNNFCMIEQEEAKKFHLCNVVKTNHAKFICPYIGSYITELARLYHWKLMQRDPQSVFYCDTDSVFTSNRKAFDPLVGEKIGQLSFEGEFDGVFLGNKTYALQNKKTEKVVFKGFKAEDFSFDELEDALLCNSSLTETHQHILSYKECLRRESDLDRKRGTFLKLVTTTKSTIPADYDKRKLFDSEQYVFNSKPFTYKELENV